MPGTILGDQDKQGQLTGTRRRVPTWVKCHAGCELGREWRIMGRGGRFRVGELEKVFPRKRCFSKGPKDGREPTVPKYSKNIPGQGDSKSEDT